MFSEMFRPLNRLGVVMCLESFNNKRLEQFHCHPFRNTTLVQPQFRTNNDNTPSRVVNPFSEKVLTEPPDFAFQNISEGFQGTIARTGYTSTVSSVVEERIDCFLQHPFFVSENHLWRAELYQLTESIVTINDTPIEIIEITRSEASALKRDQWT